MSFRRKKSTQDLQAADTGGRPKMSSRALAQVIERSSHIQGPAAEAYVARLRHASPGADPAEIVGRAREALRIGGDGQWGGRGRGGDLPRNRHHRRVVCGRRRNCRLPRGHGAVRTGTGFGVRHSSRRTGTPSRPGPGRPGRRQQHRRGLRADRAGPDQRRLGLGKHGVAAAAGSVEVQLADAQVRHEAVRPANAAR